MADTKISALTAATTPLAGTEVLPIVQSSTTKNVSVANLTAGRSVSAATLALDKGASGTVATLKGGTRTLYIYGDNDAFYIATDASLATAIGINETSDFINIYANNAERLKVDSTGLVTVKTGNVYFNTAAKGIDFSANTGAAGMTSQLLNWYEEGTFTPTYGGSTTNPTVTYSEQVGYYTRIGRLVTIGIRLVVTSATGGSGNLRVNGLPFTGLGNTGGLSLQFVLGFASNVLQAALSGTSLVLYDTYAGTSNTQSPVSALTSAGGTTYLVLGGTYMV